MFRITALNSNEEADDCNDDDDVLQEQETIVESEYLRAITLKTNGKANLARLLLTQLLETKVLNDISEDNEVKLWNIRYNCHKNIAIISEENEENDSALLHYVLALQIDDTDIHTVYRFGQLAFKLKAFEFAECAYETCLRHNKRHWSSADGLLDVLNFNKNIVGTYNWAMKLIKSNVCSRKAANTLHELKSELPVMIPFCEKLFGICPEDKITNFSFSPKSDIFFNNAISKVESSQSSSQWDVKTISLEYLSYFTIGKYILSVLNQAEQNGEHLFFSISHEKILNEAHDKDNTETHSNTVNTEIVGELVNGNQIVVDNEKKNQTETEMLTQKVDFNKMPQDSPHDDGGSAGESSNAKTDIDGTKSKPRRRCSDLHFLEQWGWHKTRKSSSRRKTQADRPETDTTLDGFLRKAFSKYVGIAFDDAWPFSCTNNDNGDKNYDSLSSDDCCHEPISLETFDKNVDDEFKQFMGKIKEQKTDTIMLCYMWLKNVSEYWCVSMPQELKSLYMNMFLKYLKYFDLSSWNQLNSNDFGAMLQITLLHLELKYATFQEDIQEVMAIWTSLYSFLMANSGTAFIEFPERFDVYKLRLLNLEYIYFNLDNKLEKCIECVDHIQMILTTQVESFALHLPHLKSSCITLNYVKNVRSELESKIVLKKVGSLFEEKNWSELSLLIENHISQSKDLHTCENWLNDFHTLNEMLLQCTWNSADYDKCLASAEKILHYSTYHYLKEFQNIWRKSINFSLSYIEAIILNEGYDIVKNFTVYLPRLIQNIIRILSYQYDNEADGKSFSTNDLQIRRSWIVLHQIMQREESSDSIVEKSKSTECEELDDCENLPMSFLLLFTAHEFTGKRQECTADNGELLHYIIYIILPNLRAPIYDDCREHVYEYIEQITFCMFGYPPKKARSRHLEDHNASPIELTWDTAIHIFDIYVPTCLPEFNSYKVESISSDMEQFLLRILSTMPKCLDPSSKTTEIKDFIAGTSIDTLDKISALEFPFKIKNIYYVLADFYFKSRDFTKAITYYIYDLAVNPSRFDSWAGMSLSKASNIETKLNGLTLLEFLSFLVECEETVRCFDKCINLKQNHILLWIEYGSFTYTISSYCSRILKNFNKNYDVNELTVVVEKKERMLNIAFNCFSLAASLQNTDCTNMESSEEKWLCQYMLGKIAEKRKENPNIYLNCYLMAANYLYECNATYPIKINHSNPTTLSVEALEVFYRTNSAIIKYIEKGYAVTRNIGDMFVNVLKKLSDSPFAFNKAKIDGNSLNALKRKYFDPTEIQANKVVKEVSGEIRNIVVPSVSNEEGAEADKIDKKIQMPQSSRRQSQESAATGTTTTTASSSSSSTSSSTNIETESDSSTDIDIKKEDNITMYSASELELIYKDVVKNLEECVVRFPEHYKSIYRLVYHYMNAPRRFRDLEQCEKLLLGQYQTSLGNVVNGLFYERKTNNFFNGIWKIPSSEIDRPGSFSSQLVKSVDILVDLLMKQNNYRTLIDVALQLYRNPDSDKRYIMDAERIRLYQQANVYCNQIMRSVLDKNKELRNDADVLNLLIEIYKMQKKCYKYMIQKDAWLSKLLADTYKFFIENKVDELPQDLNYIDLAVKLCIHEISTRKNYAKSITSLSESICSIQHLRPVYIPGLPSRIRSQNFIDKSEANMVYLRAEESDKQLISSVSEYKITTDSFSINTESRN